MPDATDIHVLVVLKHDSYEEKVSPEVGVKLRDLEVDDDKTEDVFDSGKETKLDEVGTKVLGEGDCADVSNKDLSIPVWRVQELITCPKKVWKLIASHSYGVDLLTFDLCTCVQSSWANC